MVCYMEIRETGIKERLLEYLEDRDFTYYNCPFNEAFSCNHKSVMRSDDILSIDTDNRLIRTTTTYTAKHSLMNLKTFIDVLNKKWEPRERKTVYLNCSTGTVRKGEIVNSKDGYYIVRLSDGGMARIRQDRVYDSIIEAERHI